MNRNRLLTITVICLLLLNFGTLGVLFFTKPARPHGAMRPPHTEPKHLIIERLHFDEAQQKQYESLIEVHRDKTRELNEASRNLHKQLYSLLAETSPDKTAADVLILQISENQKSIDYLNFGHFQEIKALCRPEQLNDFNQLAGELAGLFGPKGPPPERH